jgi:hypothetical protein
MRLRTLFLLTVALVAGSAGAQGWSDAYDNALTAVAAGDWSGARTAFQEAIALRPEDQSGPTSLPGPVTDPRRWRDGSPYSPNFGVAYCTFRMSDAVSGEERRTVLADAAQGFEALLAKGQTSPETFYFLMRIYSLTRDVQSQNALEARLAAEGATLTWRVDTSFVSPEERAAVLSLVPKPGNPSGTGATGAPPKTNVIKAADYNPVVTSTAIGIAGRVPVVESKYAIVIGNGEAMMSEARMSFASSDAMLVRETLIQHAGYAEDHVDVVINATAAQILASVNALVARMPADGTVLIYFAGTGYNIGGKDYYAGIDAESAQDSMHMVAVMDVYKAFLAKGASIFAFSQSNRAISAGYYFGKETPLYGRIAQSHATIPGGQVNSLVTAGTEVGAYTQAFTDILIDWRSNSVPVTEFAWQVFYKMRQGGGPQTPTLPVLTVLPADARF